MNIKNIFFIAIAFVVTISLGYQACAKTPVGKETFGIGLQLGDPSAITGKVMPSDIFAFQFFIGAGNWYHDYDGRRSNAFLTGADFVFHPMMIYDGWKTCALNLTLGFGAAVGVYRDWYYNNQYNDWRYNDHHATLYLRFVTGVNLWFKKFPLETFVEMTPALRLINPDPIGFHMFWVVGGARWFF